MADPREQNELRASHVNALNGMVREQIAGLKERGERHDDCVVLYLYLVGLLKLLKPYGKWMSPDPAPLRVDEIKSVFKALVSLPDETGYQHQTLSTHTKDGTRVWLIDGVITVKEKGEGWSVPALNDG